MKVEIKERRKKSRASVDNKDGRNRWVVLNIYVNIQNIYPTKAGLVHQTRPRTTNKTQHMQLISEMRQSFMIAFGTSSIFAKISTTVNRQIDTYYFYIHVIARNRNMVIFIQLDIKMRVLSINALEILQDLMN